MSTSANSLPINSAYLISERAYLLHREGRYEAALTLFEGLLEMEPNNNYYKDAVSALYLALNRPQEAVRWASVVLDQDPSYMPALVRRCEGHLILGNVSEVTHDLDQIRRLGGRTHARRIEMKLQSRTS